ncbi:MAG TPA: hypothetical protein VLZ44_09670 [Treponemataceae bacterium]|nr:hypothetical protein [Treponemataceae bacterium]
MKKKILLGLTVILFFGACASKTTLKAPSSSALKTLNLPFEVENRSDSIQIRTLNTPMLSLLDFAAYYQNPIKLQEDIERPPEYKGLASGALPSEYPFTELDSILQVAPDFLFALSPVAHEPFLKKLREKGGGDSLSTSLRSIENEKWGEIKVYRPLQRVSKLWGLSRGDSLEWWVEVESTVWVNRAPFWARLKKRATTNELEILKQYQEKLLSSEEVMNWARTLTSYWYPTLNTDLEQHIPGAPWHEYSPYFIIKGNPMGKAIRVAIDIKPFRLSPEALLKLEEPDDVSSVTTRSLDTSSLFRKQTLESLGSCPVSDSVISFQKSLTQILNAIPKEQNAFSSSGMLWFRRNAEYLLAEKITAQDSLHNPLPRLLELKAHLDSLNIQLLVVPIPVKEEVYPDLLVPGTSLSLCINPASREFTKEMLEAGLDVIDLYPILQAARAGDVPPNYVFQRYDTHWSTSGLLASLELIASRVTQYSWYTAANPTQGALEMRDTIITREGDLVSHVPDSEKNKYVPDTLFAYKVFKNAEPYIGKKEAPILLMGDSFTGVFESVDQRSGGPGSLLAFATGLDVQVLTSWGGGPGVRHRMKRITASKKLIIYMMTARDFWRSPMEWDAF